MIDRLAENLARLERDLAASGKTRVEAIPDSSEAFPVPAEHLELLHRFARENPIYRGWHESKVGGIDCTVYEADIDRYWLGSIQHSSSRAPFSPTWIMSAYVCALHARDMGYGQLVDIGSGDGRIAFCGTVAGLKSHSIEIDKELYDLQGRLAEILDFDPHHADAALFEYPSLGLDRPMFFIGGLAQMGGAELASSVMDRVSGIGTESGWALAGTLSPKYAPDPLGEAGWGTVMEQRRLERIRTVSLPTYWTFGEPEKTPYIFARANSNPN